MKLVLGTFAALAIMGLTFVQPAEARCFWNGFATVCIHHDYGYGFDRPHLWNYGPRPYWWGGY